MNLLHRLLHDCLVSNVLVVLGSLLFTFLASDTTVTEASQRPNILFITMDDMNWDSVGCYGCPIEDISPNIDSLARGGIRFEHAYVQTSSCVPSRNAFLTGRYPHSSGVIGFFNVQPSFKTLPELLRESGYYTAVVNKPRDSSMTDDYDRYWDYHQIFPNSIKRGAKQYAVHMQDVLKRVSAAEKPFFCVANIADPHKPFFEDPKVETGDFDKTPPSRKYGPQDIPMPGFLPAHPKIRKEMCNYYNSVKRGDDCVGAILRVLREARLEDKTVIIFVSDHGMPLPYAKSSLYPDGVRTPWIVQWPGVAEPGAVDKAHLVSAIDLAPTVLDIASVARPEGLQGESMVGLLQGEKQAGRDMVFVEFNENAGGLPYPMRGVHTEDYVYIFNPWSDGEYEFVCAANYYQTYKTMKKLSASDSEVNARLQHLDHRVVEELYHLPSDPYSKVNVINDSSHAAAAESMRGALEQWMKDTDDYALEAFTMKDDSEALADFKNRLDGESLVRSKTVQWKRWKNRSGGVGKRDQVYSH